LLIHSLLLLEEEKEEEGARRHSDFFISLHKMPRVTGTTEHTARSNSLDVTKFRSLVKRGYIDIDKITPKFIESIRKRHGWENCSATNFHQNYRRVADTHQLALDLNGAQVG
jgi:hypothetical protein